MPWGGGAAAAVVGFSRNTSNKPRSGWPSSWPWIATNAGWLPSCPGGGKLPRGFLGRGTSRSCLSCCQALNSWGHTTRGSHLYSAFGMPSGYFCAQLMAYKVPSPQHQYVRVAGSAHTHTHTADHPPDSLAYIILDQVIAYHSEACIPIGCLIHRLSVSERLQRTLAGSIMSSSLSTIMCRALLFWPLRLPACRTPTIQDPHTAPSLHMQAWHFCSWNGDISSKCNVFKQAAQSMASDYRSGIDDSMCSHQSLCILECRCYNSTFSSQHRLCKPCPPVLICAPDPMQLGSRSLPGPAVLHFRLPCTEPSLN